MIRLLLIVLCLAAKGWAQGYVCAEGGGNAGKGVWADEVFGWMVDKGGHGKVVILGAVPLDEDSRPALFTRLGAASVESLVVTGENADTQATFDAIASASVVFIRGGSQSRYVQWWKGTRTQKAIVEVWKKGGVVAGTSAGCAVLGEVVYDAIHGSLSAREALADGRHENLSLTTDFLNLVPGVLFDTHFTERGRLARLPVMLAVCKEDLKKADILGIGVDPRTAVCVGPDGIAEIRGEGTVTFLRLSAGSKVAIKKGSPPTVSGIAYSQLCAGHRYDLVKREVVSRPIEAKERQPAGTLPVPDLLMDGGEDESATLGSVRVSSAAPDAWLTTGVSRMRGENRLPSFVVVPRLLAEKAAANNMAGAQQALADEDRRVLIAILADTGSALHTKPPATLGAVSRAALPGAASDPNRSVMVLDARAITHAGVVQASRTRPVMEGAVLHLLAPGWSIDLGTGEVSR